METKIIKVVFGGRRYTTTAKRTRTDYGQMFEFVDITLPETFEVIFSNSDTSAGMGKKMIGSNQRCLIPDEYLKTGQPIYAWVLVHDGESDGRHMYSIKSPVDDMPDTSPEEPTPVEQSVISQAITALNSAVDTTTQKAQEATESANRAEQAAEGAEGYAERAEAAQSASESARDIALEAKVSAQTSAATATEKASEAISSATTASQSALTAETASESAGEYASASAESASQASQSADTASGKASDASESAQTASQSATEASQKASEASQSASTAVQAKTDAQSAKTASETAQGLAESARDEAVTAKTSAESARDEAQDIADGITGKVEQIDSNTTRIESLEDDRYKPYAVDTASGSIASFPDGADNIPLKSCIVQIEPVQSGSGDPSPDNVRPITGWTGCEVKHSGADTSNPTTYPITFPTEAGTVYGAYVDVTGGELVVDRAMVDLGTCNIRKDTDTSITNYLYYATLPDRLPYYANNGDPVFLKCSALKPIETAKAYSYLKTLEPNTIVIRPTYTNYVCIKSEIDTVEAMKQSLDGVQLVYELAEPIHYPLTPTEIKTLLGTNNIWSNTGDTEVTYRADTTLYIKRLTESDTDMVADANIVSGQYFMVGNDLYKATVNIASGASVIVGTNAMKVSLAQALNEIKEA